MSTLEYNPQWAGRDGIRNGKPADLDMVQDVELLACASKKRRRVVLWNPSQPAFGPVYHLRVNFQPLPAPARCLAPEEECTWCEATRLFNNKETQTCKECGKTKPRRLFPMGAPMMGKGMFRHIICTHCTRLRKRAEMRVVKAYNEQPNKICTRCEENKPKAEFYRNKRTGDGYEVQCIACKKLGVQERRQK